MNSLYLLTELYYPEQTSTGYILTKIAESLANDYKVKVITGPPTNFFQVQNSQAFETHNGVSIVRCSGTKFNKNSLVGRFFNILTRSFAIFCEALIRCKYSDIIIVVTNPPLLPFLSLLTSKLRGCKLILLIHDVYPDVLIATKTTKFILPINFFMNFLNNIIYSYSSKIIVIGRDMDRLVKNKMSCNRNMKTEIVCIYNWAEVESIKPIKKENNKLLQDLRLGNKFIVTYIGNMGRTHGVEYLAEAASKLREKKNIHFLAIGSGHKQLWLEKYIDNFKLENITFISLTNRPRSDQSTSLNACDVALISFIPGMAGISVPSRMYNHMAAGKPIIAVTDDCSELALVVREENIGWVVLPGDIENLVRTIKFSAKNLEICKEMGKRAAEVARSKYSFERTLQAYKNVIEKVSSESK